MGGRRLRLARARVRGRAPGRQDPRGPRRACRTSRRSSSSIRRETRRAPSRWRSSARAAGRATPRSWTRARPPSRARTPSRSSTRPGPPARRRAASSSHGNYRDVVTMCAGTRRAGVGRGHLPLPPARALVRAAHPARGLRQRRRARLLRRRPARIVPELSEVRPTYLPSVPRIFEKLYTLVTAQADPRDDPGRHPGRARRPRAAGGGASRCRPSSRRTSTAPRSSCSARCAPRSAGTSARRVTGAAPIAKEILEFFFACGVPVLEGYGLTETATVATASSVTDHRIGSVGRALPGMEIRIAEDGEVLLRGPNVFQGYYRHADASSFGEVVEGWLHTGDLGSPGRRRLPLHHRPQEGHHHHGGRQEPHAGERRERPQAVALDLAGPHARRPPPLPGGAGHAGPGGDRRLRARARRCRPTSRPSRASRRSTSSSRAWSTRPTSATRRSSRSSASTSSTTTSRRRRASSRRR